MELHATRHADVVVLRPAGRIDHSNAEDFTQSLGQHLDECRSGCDSIVFDLSGLEYVSSAGLRVLMLASKKVAPAGGRVVLAAPQKVVREILEISRFQYVFPIVPSIPEALAALSAKAAASQAGG